MQAMAKSYVLLQIHYFCFVLNIWFHFFLFIVIFFSIFCFIGKRLEFQQFETREVKSYENPKSLPLSYLCGMVAI